MRALRTLAPVRLNNARQTSGNRRLRRASFAIALLAVILEFTISGNVLENIGLDYYSPAGNPLVKLHPATCLVMIAACMTLMLARPAGSGLIRLCRGRPGLAAFIMLTPFLGIGMGRFVFGAGVLGAGMVAAIVCSLGFAWGLGEISGYRHTLEQHPLRARWFYGAYVIIVAGAAITVALWSDLIALNIGVQVMNAFMLPLLLGVLIALSVMALPPAQRLRGAYLWLVLTVCALTAVTGVLGGVSGLGLLG